MLCLLILSGPVLACVICVWLLVVGFMQELLERERARLERETEELRTKVNKMVTQGAGAQAAAEVVTPVPTANDGSEELARQLEAVKREKAAAEKEMAAMRQKLEKQKEELANAKSGACTIL